MCSKKDYTYKKRYKTTKFINFVNFKVQKTSQFIIILALIFRVTVLIQHMTINFRAWYPLSMFAKLFWYDDIKRLSRGYCPMGNATRAVPSHGISLGIPFSWAWTSLLIDRPVLFALHTRYQTRKNTSKLNSYPNTTLI